MDQCDGSTGSDEITGVSDTWPDSTQEFNVIVADGRGYIVKERDSVNTDILRLWEPSETVFSLEPGDLIQRIPRIRVHPTPSDAKTILYTYYEQARPIGLGTHIPLLFYKYFEALEWGAAFMALYRLNDERMAIASQKFEKLLALIRQDETIQPNKHLVRRQYKGGVRFSGDGA